MINTGQYNSYIRELQTIVSKGDRFAEASIEPAYTIFCIQLACLILSFSEKFFYELNSNAEDGGCPSQKRFRLDEDVMRFAMSTCIASVMLCYTRYMRKRERLRAKNKLTALAAVFTSRDSLMVQHLPKEVRAHIAKFLNGKIGF